MSAGRSALMMAADAETVADLNARARAHRVGVGEVAADGILVRNLAALCFFHDRGVPVVADFSLNASNELTATADTLSREVEKFFRNLRADSSEQMRKTGT